jgi:hypothetical protein
LAIVTVACEPGIPPDVEPTATLNLLDGAAAEATALVQQAEATAIVLQAQVQATALVEQARLAGGTPTSAVENQLVYVSPTPASMSATPIPEQETSVISAAGEATAVEVLAVDFAAEGGMIMVRFLAPPEEAEKWWPGTVSVMDEGNDVVYREIPVLPKVGPLIGRPKVAGQPGYVMLVNAPPYLEPGVLVTVELGSHRFEHVPVEKEEAAK